VGNLKDKVYETNPYTVEELKNINREISEISRGRTPES
jgi:hypothetical protein